ncbi:asparagine synthase (glutamine-hydrolyzing) [Alphaproteobacteria bacterium]|nr:asparagine synthase (glutamine-hydrolyzing) [Alphaproteobacteria bacterium]
MCGIAAIINKRSLTKNPISTLKNMSKLISHRGPDQAGYLEYNNILLSHVRLPVMDPRNLGRQPMSNDNKIYIIFNGEIFNFKEIRIKLIKLGYKFISDSDTEVALNAYKEWGVQSFDQFNGDWVICILDKNENTFLVAKDGLGTKPLYIYEDQENLSFCSEIKGFEALKPPEFDPEYLGLNYKSVYDFNGTKFKDIYQTKPGSVLKINLETLEKKIFNWFEPLNNLVPINPDYNYNKEDFYNRIYNATKLRLDADLKIGTSLSGGLDSSVIFSVLNLIDSRENSNKSIDLNPVIVDYKESLTTKYAQDLTNLHDRKATIINTELKYNIDSLSYLFSQLEIVDEYNKQLELYKKQKSLGIDVSIDGLGPDEFLGMPIFMPQISFTYYNNLIDINKINYDFHSDTNINLMTKYFGSMAKNKNKAVINFGSFIDTKNYFNDYLPESKKDFNENNFTIKDYIKDLENFNMDFQYTFFKTHCGFLQYFLHKWDRASMANSVEIRSPFLDKNVYLYMLSLPLEMKLKNGKLKSILNDSFSHLLPNYITGQKFKQGLPVSKKNIEDLSIKNVILEVFSQQNFNENCWNAKKIKKDYKDNKNIDLIWRIVKYYLLKKGFKDRLRNISETKIDFSTVPTLN